MISDLVSSHLLLNVFIHNTQKKERERDERTRYKIHSGTTTTTTNIIIIYIVVYLYFLPPGLQMDHFLVRERHDFSSFLLFFLMNFEVVFVLLFFKFLFCFSCWFFFVSKNQFFSLSLLSPLSHSHVFFFVRVEAFLLCASFIREMRETEREREKKRGEKILVALFLSLALQRETLFFEQSRHTTQQL